MICDHEVLFHRDSDIDIQETKGGFYTQLFTTLDAEDINLTALRTDLDGELDRFTNVGSGWTITAILLSTTRIEQYRPMKGSSYIPTPKMFVGIHAKSTCLIRTTCVLLGPSYLHYIHPHVMQ